MLSLPIEIQEIRNVNMFCFPGGDVKEIGAWNVWQSLSRLEYCRPLVITASLCGSWQCSQEWDLYPEIARRKWSLSWIPSRPKCGMKLLNHFPLSFLLKTCRYSVYIVVHCICMMGFKCHSFDLQYFVYSETVRNRNKSL